jgi:hypothetical protein
MFSPAGEIQIPTLRHRTITNTEAASSALSAVQSAGPDGNRTVNPMLIAARSNRAVQIPTTRMKLPDL